MIQKILGYNFEVDKNGDKHSTKFGSNISSALKKMTFDSFLIATYNLQIDDRMTYELKESFSFEEINQLSEAEILQEIENRIIKKYN